ncbi:hypothetical protein HMN09_01180300 [Mycena chlorophos]|uniref:Uncharacterized protein n=1 Tax=Mycena chlorophos TaxID=658473 RepID=A0A8H6VZH6_MYCCL|nr:hypothetical protein HMN09_01180300 [Mycena chlorophos]
MLGARTPHAVPRRQIKSHPLVAHGILPSLPSPSRPTSSPPVSLNLRLSTTMRFIFSLLAVFALLLAFVAAHPSAAETQSPPRRLAASLFRPSMWTWPQALSLPLVQSTDSNAASEHVRRHGPRRRGAAHP